MRNYNDDVEAAYLASKRQGDQMRDPARERSPHEDRRNRGIENEMQPAAGGRYERSTEPKRQTMDTYRPADKNLMDVLDRDHRGKGPRNYKRSDDRIKEIVCDMLCDNPDIDASSIEVDVKNSEVILSGEVNEKYTKHLAEDLVQNVTGVSNVENRIRVNQVHEDGNQ
jgi:hypothetical protein